MNFLLIFSHSQQLVPMLAPVSIIFYVAIRFFKGRRIEGINNKFVLFAWIGFAYFVFISFFHSHDLIFQDPVAFIAGDGKVVYTSLVVALLLMFPVGESQMRGIAIATAWVATIIGLISLGALFFKFQYQDMFIGAMFTESRTVLVGFLGTKNPFAGSVGQFSILLFSYFIACSPRGRDRKLVIFALLVSVLCLGLSGSRGYLVAFGMAAIYVLFVNRGVSTIVKANALLKYRFAMTALMFAGMLVFYFQFRESVESAVSGEDLNMLRRFELYQYALSLFSESILIGVGPGSITQPSLLLSTLFPVLMSQRVGGLKIDGLEWLGDLPIGQHSHNIILQMLVDYGAVGFIFFYGVIFFVWNELSKARARSDKGKQWLIIYSAMLVYYLVSGMVAGYSIYSPSAVICLLLLYPLFIYANRRGRDV